MLNEGNRRFKIANISSRKWSHTSLVLANVQREKFFFQFSEPEWIPKESNFPYFIVRKSQQSEAKICA